MHSVNRLIRRPATLLSVAMICSLSACGTFPGWISASGPSREQVQSPRDTRRIEGIKLVDVDDALAKKLAKAKQLGRFSDIFPSHSSNNYLIGPGDIIEVSIWEAQPPMLFSGVSLDGKAASTSSPAVTLPNQMVSPDGTISIPFAGKVAVKGRNTDQIGDEITRRLHGKANRPQVLVRVAKNNTSNVTVVGEVSTSATLPLTPKGERLIDALALAGGVKQPISRMAIQLSRGETTSTMALDSIIRDPKQNIMLKPGDVVTALFQPLSFSVLGATGKNDEIPFEAQGISLAQALARSGGLNDMRADARGVFIFRFEDPKLLGQETTPKTVVNGMVPIVYQVDLRDPASFFVTQNFPIQNHDILYVTNSPVAEFQKFLSLIISVAVPSVTLNNAVK